MWVSPRCPNIWGTGETAVAGREAGARRLLKRGCVKTREKREKRIGYWEAAEAGVSYQGREESRDNRGRPAQSVCSERGDMRDPGVSPPAQEGICYTEKRYLSSALHSAPAEQEGAVPGQPECPIAPGPQRQRNLARRRFQVLQKAVAFGWLFTTGCCKAANRTLGPERCSKSPV
jgi:hypothetical protein